MADQNSLLVFLVISTAFLWGIVIWLACIHISAYLKNRVRMKAVVLNAQGEGQSEYELGKQKEILIGKSTPAGMVNIDFSDSAYAGSIQEEHAAFVRCGAYWYICARAEKGMVGLRQQDGGTVYKLRRDILYRIRRGDMVYISYEKIMIR